MEVNDEMKVICSVCGLTTFQVQLLGKIKAVASDSEIIEINKCDAYLRCVECGTTIPREVRDK